MKNCIVYSVNNYKKAILWFLYSVSSLKYHRNKIETYLLVNIDFEQKYEKFINSVFSDIKIIKVNYKDDFFNIDLDYLNEKKLSINAYYRFLIFKNTIIKDYDNVLYLDIDTEIYNDINSIFDFPVNNLQFFGNVLKISKENKNKADYTIKRINDSIRKNNLKELNFNFQSFIGYCNNGVLLIKQNKMNRLIDSNKIFKLFQYYLQYNFHWPDQDVTNYIFNSVEYGRYQFVLPTKYNYYKCTNEYSPINDSEIIIRHYAGQNGYKRALECNKFDVTNGKIKEILKI